MKDHEDSGMLSNESPLPVISKTKSSNKDNNQTIFQEKTPKRYDSCDPNLTKSSKIPQENIQKTTGINVHQ